MSTKRVCTGGWTSGQQSGLRYSASAHATDSSKFLHWYRQQVDIDLTSSWPCTLSGMQQNATVADGTRASFVLSAEWCRMRVTNSDLASVWMKSSSRPTTHRNGSQSVAGKNTTIRVNCREWLRKDSSILMIILAYVLRQLKVFFL